MPLSLLVGFTAVRAATIAVPADQPTLADALSVAVDGDTVTLAAGVHAGSVRPTADVEIVGAGSGVTVVTGNGDVFELDGVTVTIRGITVAPIDRRAFEIVNGANVVLSDVIVAGHTAGHDGLGVRIKQDSVLDVSDSVFSALIAPGKRGAAIHVRDDAVVTVRSTRFEGVQAEDGAAIDVQQGTLVLESCTFDTGDARNDGGFVRAEQSAVRVSESSFAGGVAGGDGAAILATGGTDLVVQGSAFEGGAAAGGGGAIAVDSASVALLGSFLCGNTAGVTGGAVRIAGSGAPAIANNLFVENQAATGGALWLSGGAPAIANNHFLGNQAVAGGAIRAADAVFELTNNLFAWTVAGDGLYATASTTVTGSARYNAWFDNADTDATGLTLDGTNLSADPALRAYSLDGNCGNDDLEPTADSPLVDAGDPTGRDPDGSRADIGAWGGPSAYDAAVVDEDGDGYSTAADCDDADATVHPGADDPCDGVDNDCDGVPDEGERWYADADGDGFGDAEAWTDACTAPSGYVGNGSDCDDDAPAVSPAATETCNGVDDDCDGVADDDAGEPWYADGDGDGFGDPASSVVACDAPDGHVADATDCDDASATVNPDADEVWYDRIDQDCDGTDANDRDGDGFPSDVVGGGDCDDDEASVYPGAEDVPDDGIDQNCNGQEAITEIRGGDCRCASGGPGPGWTAALSLLLVGLRRRR